MSSNRPREGTEDLFAEILLAAIERRRPHPVASEWFVRKSLEAVRRDEPLDVALGLAVAGRPSLQRRLLKRRRDLSLCAALDAVSLDPSLGPWRRCQRLAPLAASFVSDAWPRVRNLASAPGDWPAWKVHIFDAARTDLPIPISASGLRKILPDNPTFRGKTSAATILAQYL